jgi:hypothetical protein
MATKKGASLAVKTYVGDNKTLLAFNFGDPSDAQALAGFTIECKPPGLASYYLNNELRFGDPSGHHQVADQDPFASINAPFQKYRWIHVPGQAHQGLVTATGSYTYTVTPRYFDERASMQPMDPTLSASVTVPVGPFRKGAVSIGFTRGYMQSEAFARHFGKDAPLQPSGRPFLYDTAQKAAVGPAGQGFTFADEYAWMGASARALIFSVLNGVLHDRTLQLDVFAYDLDEPDIMRILLQLAAEGRARIILDDAALHHAGAGRAHKTLPAEDQFEQAFRKRARKPAQIVRGSFGRYSHDKVLIVSRGGVATQVLTGSTNFSVTGLYVNANHVLLFDDPHVAGVYAQVFEQSWTILKANPRTSRKAASEFAATSLATQPFTYQTNTVPRMSITFSPHSEVDANKLLAGIAERIQAQAAGGQGSVLFAVMQITGGETPVYQALNEIYRSPVYSYGISDAPDGTHLYAPGSEKGVLVTGKPGRTLLPPPFDQVRIPPGHEIHDKFVVCGLNSADPVVYCGSSNLASGGEVENGDNLLAIHDQDVAAVFAIEALLLVDHYNFLDRYAATQKAGRSVKRRPAAARPATARRPRPARPATPRPAAARPAAPRGAARRGAKAAASGRKRATTSRPPAAKSPRARTTHSRSGLRPGAK